MVHPYLRRRNGEESVEYPSKELEDILSKTLGVPLFQEQAMKIAIVAAGFTPTEADELRRSMATFKLKGLVTQFQEKLINGMLKNGYTQEYAERVFRQLEGFGSYGFPESHAASFALLVYVSAWIKNYYPDVFCCGLLNSQPMGFYAPAQLIIDAQKHGVKMHPVDVNHSNWDNKLEEQDGKYFVLRLGFRQVKGLRKDDMKILVSKRNQGYKAIHELREAGVSQAAIEILAEADAFNSLGLDRRQALWETSALKDRPIDLFASLSSESVKETDIALPVMTLSEHVVHDYGATALSLKAHPVSFIREKLQQLHVVSTRELAALQDGAFVKVAGLVLVRQRPGTAGGVCFMTIEDETGVANVIVFQKLFDSFRKEILQSRLIMVQGKLQKVGDVIHVIVKTCHNFTKLLRRLTPYQDEKLLAPSYAHADEKIVPYHPKNKRAQIRQDVQKEIFPVGRNFR